VPIVDLLNQMSSHNSKLLCLAYKLGKLAISKYDQKGNQSWLLQAQTAIQIMKTPGKKDWHRYCIPGG